MNKVTGLTGILGLITTLSVGCDDQKKSTPEKNRGLTPSQVLTKESAPEEEKLGAEPQLLQEELKEQANLTQKQGESEGFSQEVPANQEAIAQEFQADLMAMPCSQYTEEMQVQEQALTAQEEQLAKISQEFTSNMPSQSEQYQELCQTFTQTTETSMMTPSQSDVSLGAMSGQTADQQH